MFQAGKRRSHGIPAGCIGAEPATLPPSGSIGREDREALEHNPPRHGIRHTTASFPLPTPGHGTGRNRAPNGAHRACTRSCREPTLRAQNRSGIHHTFAPRLCTAYLRNGTSGIRVSYGSVPYRTPSTCARTSPGRPRLEPTDRHASDARHGTQNTAFQPHAGECPCLQHTSSWFYMPCSRNSECRRSPDGRARIAARSVRGDSSPVRA
jgi:hypothetical protein